MSDMELASINEQDTDHRMIATAVADLEKLGYRVKGIESTGSNRLSINCYCPRCIKGQ
jgi:hypothetical protein